MEKRCVREVLPNVQDFKKFWKDEGPFRYALTSAEYPPVLLDQEEWIFGDDPTEVLKSLMGFDQEKMAFVKTPFNPGNKAVLRPEGLSDWKISHFPEAWNTIVSDFFIPEGHLTLRVMEEAERLGLAADEPGISRAFFSLLAGSVEDMGYVFLFPKGKAKSASIAPYLAEWEEDESDAGIL